MKKLIIPFVYILLLMSTPGCYYAFYPQTGSQLYIETQPETIEVYSDEPEQKYEILGPIAAEVPGDVEAATKYLKKKAAKLGASAVIKVNLSKPTSFPGSTSISGIAVKIKES
ncbi:hypothetical protein GM418_00580 [Maribellus comscasis]|uniref:Uncharacterized protein n=1 Tax=Maribellus comscasis TaxID=2681766 RepID=A0A6I6JIV2_9BACT|nr:hypothetical protein [Maribellus comscasis]QGY42201.1 hypothetical protein GM418_00580 [Maribellus comscasis]